MCASLKKINSIAHALVPVSCDDVILTVGKEEMRIKNGSGWI
jgi:hypothetical protein